MHQSLILSGSLFFLYLSNMVLGFPLSLFIDKQNSNKRGPKNYKNKNLIYMKVNPQLLISKWASLTPQHSLLLYMNGSSFQQNWFKWLCRSNCYVNGGGSLASCSYIYIYIIFIHAYRYLHTCAISSLFFWLLKLLVGW